MKFRMIGAVGAVAMGGLFAACSGDTEPGESGNSSVGFEIVTMEGVQITEVAFDLNTQAGTDVIAGTIPVPNDGSVIDGFLGALEPADYALSISATGTLNGDPVSCVSEPSPTNFTLAPSEALTLPDISLVCTIENPLGDDSGSVSFGVNVTVEQIDIVQQVVESFSVTPVTAVGEPSGDGTCTYPPMNVHVENSNVAISYSWTSAPNGTFAFNDATNTDGTYTCADNGEKTLTVTATLGDVTASKDVAVSCTGDCISLCGNGTVDPGEQCDEDTERCDANCQIVPICGDGIVDAPEECDEGGPTETCTADCTIDGGDGICLDCINSETELGLGDFNQTSCDPVAGCVEVRDCVLDSGCFAGIPAECYCGIGSDLNLCETDVNFVPTGPCATEIIANAGAGATGADILNRFYDPAYDLGLAMLLISSTQQSMCVDECQL